MKIRIVQDTPHIGGKGWDWVGKKGKIYTANMRASGCWIRVTIKGKRHSLKLLESEYEVA